MIHWTWLILVIPFFISGYILCALMVAGSDSYINEMRGNWNGSEGWSSGGQVGGQEDLQKVPENDTLREQQLTKSSKQRKILDNELAEAREKQKQISIAFAEWFIGMDTVIEPHWFDDFLKGNEITNKVNQEGEK